MTHRSKHLAPYVILCGIILFLGGLSYMQYNRIIYLEKCLCENNNWLSMFELKQIENEINRLDAETKSVLKRD